MGILKAVGEIFKLAFGENDFVKSLFKPEDPAKETAENTRKILELQKERSRLLEQQAREGK